MCCDICQKANTNHPPPGVVLGEGGGGGRTYVEVAPQISLQLSVNDVTGLLAVKEEAGVPVRVVSTSSRVSLLSRLAAPSVTSASAAAGRARFHHHAVAGLQGDASGGLHRHLLLGHTWTQGATERREGEGEGEEKEKENAMAFLPKGTFSFSLLSSDPELMV